MIPITLHAVRRYIERVIGVACYDKSDGIAVAKFERRTGITREEIEEIIRSDVEPKTPAKVLRNRSRRVIRGETAKFVVDGGRVITCYLGEEYA